jgi:Dolichyl-phosphate-mannose-protein mannosyltransferase/Bacterial membrane protein YfhO
MKDSSTNDPQGKLEDDHSSTDDYLSEKEHAGLRARLATAAALTLLPLVFFYPAVKGAIILAPGDGWSQNLGVRFLIGEMIRNGQLPLWNPYIFCGTPLLGAIQPGALYPPNWLFTVFSPKTAMNLVVITTYHVALIGAYLYARRIGCNRIGSMIAGIAFAFGGFMTAHLGHTNLIATGAWLPWVLLALEELYLNLRWRWVALGASFIALLFFAGGPQVTFYALMVAGAYGLFSLKYREERERRGRFLFGAAAMSVCGALIGAIQLLPTRELQQQGERAAITYVTFADFSVPPQYLFQMIFPYFFGGGGQSPYKIPGWGKLGATETAGYVGMLAMIFGLIALVGQFKQKRRNRLVWFWAGCAAVAVLLALGYYLPFSIHKLLYHIPVYNLFSASGRHMFEFDFAAGVLAGLGVTWVSRNKGEFVWRAIWIGVGLLALIVGVTAIVYRFFVDYLVMGPPVSAGAKSFSNPEFVIPVVFFVLSVLAVVLYALCRERSAILKNVMATAMVALFTVDVASFGFFCEWRAVPPNLPEKLADPPTVKYIKGREPDLNSFRVISYSTQLHGRNYDLLDATNISIPRGLQSANGYDPVYLLRYKALAGDMSFIGEVQELSAFGPDDRSFNLLNLKYLLLEQLDLMGGAASVEREGIRFLDAPLNLLLKPGRQVELKANTTATELAIISAMGASNHVPNGAPVVTIDLYTKDGRVIERQLRAGQHTSDWAYDLPYARAPIKHARAPVVESVPGEDFEGHYYLARFPLDRSEIDRIVFKYELEDAYVAFRRASFHDAEDGRSTAISAASFLADRWRKLTQFGEVEVYENTKALPRAWFARRAAVESSADALRIIKTGKMKDGSPFDPAETVLFEKEEFADREFVPPQIGDPSNAEAQVVRYEPRRIELRTRNPQPGFLVLSEIYYRGWDAWIDGRRAPVERVNYLLRGLAVPAGDHHIEFVFSAHSFRAGAVLSLFGVLLLFVGANRRVRGKVESWLDGPVTRMLTLAWANSKRLAPPVLTAVESKLSALSRSKFVMIVAVVGVLIYGYILVKFAVYAVGGSDSSGYLRLARSLLRGDIVQRVTELDLLGLPDEFLRNFIPLGCDPGSRAGTMTPPYSVGLPLLMAAGALIGGWEYGPFLVNPIAGALSLILIYLIGLELGLPRGFSIAGAIMLAASPTFVYLTLQPMSEAMAMFWSLVVIFGALRSRKRDGWALLAGAGFGMAFLTRQTSILLLIPLLFTLRLKPKTILYFILGGLPTAAIFFEYNAAVFGHPLETGYGRIGLWQALRIGGFKERLDHYWYWIKITMSPLPLLCWLAVAADRKVEWRNRLMLLSWFGAFFLFYCCYSVYDEWWHTGFLLPGYPALILGAVLIARDLPGLLRRLVSESNLARLKWVVLIVMVAVTLSHERRYSRKLDIFSVGAGEAWRPAACSWADKQLPSKSLIASMQMSGALKFYTDRPIFRWDAVTPGQWPEVKKHAAERGYQWYALLAPSEVEEAQKRLGGKWTKLGMLNQIGLWQIEPTSE